MSSISTKRGDSGETASPGGERLSKAALRVEASGCVDELNSAIGMARAYCDDAEIAGLLLGIQRELFTIGSAISTKEGARKPVPVVGDALLARLDAAVERLEAEPGIVRDWTIPGAHRCSAPLEVARAVCRRAERALVRFLSAGERVQPNVLKYLNRLSDVLWLCARCIDVRRGVDARLRDERHPGPPWSRAW